MDTFDGGASAPTDAQTVVTEAESTATPNPISTEGNAQQRPAGELEGKEVEKKPLSAREALLKASETVKNTEKEPDSAKDKDGKAKATAEADAKALADKKAADAVAKAKTPQVDQTQSKPVDTQQKPTSSTHEAPARFSPDAKAAWESAPEPVRAEVHRAIRELEDGYQKHRADAEAFNDVREFDQMAKQYGTSIKAALTNYTNLERTLRSNPMQGIEEVCNYVGVSLREIAAVVMGQSPEHVQSQQDATIRNLMQEVDQLKRQLGGVTGNMQARQQQETFSVIDQFKADPKHSRFEELADDIAFMLETKRANSLDEAYSLADRLNPAPSAASPAASAATIPDLTAQTQKGSKSVTGAPSAGSDPAGRKKPSSSIRDSLRKAAGDIL